MHTTRRRFLTQVGGGLGLLQRLSNASAQPAARTTSIKDFNAKGDGASLDTVPIQQAIDKASRSGGGIVLFPPGSYVTGTILLRTGVTLHLAAGATILGSLNPADYRLLEPFTDGVGTARGYALIGCIDAHDIGIRGEGTIDGRGAALHAAGGQAPSAKPFLLLCLRSANVAFHGVTLLNSGAWTMHLLQCSDVTVTAVSIRSLGLPNNDGIDIDSSRNVRVERCTIDTGDDAICLKTTSNKPCTEITIADCTLSSRCAAFKIGTESAGDFSAIRVTDCHVLKADLGAIKILSVDGANIRDVLVERLRVDTADTPIFLRLGARGRTFRPGDTSPPARKALQHRRPRHRGQARPPRRHPALRHPRPPHRRRHPRTHCHRARKATPQPQHPPRTARTSSGLPRGPHVRHRLTRLRQSSAVTSATCESNRVGVGGIPGDATSRASLPRPARTERSSSLPPHQRNPQQRPHDPIQRHLKLQPRQASSSPSSGRCKIVAAPPGTLRPLPINVARVQHPRLARCAGPPAAAAAPRPQTGSRPADSPGPPATTSRGSAATAAPRSRPHNAPSDGHALSGCTAAPSYRRRESRHLVPFPAE